MIHWHNLMEFHVSFVLWASIYLSVIVLLYLLFLKDKVDPGKARLFLLTGLLLSLGLSAGGLLNIWPAEPKNSDGAFFLPEIIVGASSGAEKMQLEIVRQLSGKELLWWLSGGISLLLLLRVIIGAGLLVFNVFRYGIKNIHGHSVVVMPASWPPFSFFGKMFLPERMLNDPALEKVLLHEHSHVRRLHMLDLLLLELLVVFFWFHPAVWFFRREIKLIHEFQADRDVLRLHPDTSSYQRLLLNETMVSVPIPLLNSFHLPPLKKRFMMMTKKFPQRPHKLVWAFVSLTAVSFLLFSVQNLAKAGMITSIASADVLVEASHISNGLSAPAGNDKPVFTVVEDVPGFPGGNQELMNYLGRTLRFPEAGKDAGMQGTVFVSFQIWEDGSIHHAKILRGLSAENVPADTLQKIMMNWPHYQLGEPPSSIDELKTRLSSLYDNEVIRVVEAMPAWEPGYQRGEAVRVQFNLPVRFTLITETSREKPASDDSSRQDDIRSVDLQTLINQPRTQQEQNSEDAVVDMGMIYVDGKLYAMAEHRDRLDQLAPVNRITHIEVISPAEALKRFGVESRVMIITLRED